MKNKFSRKSLLLVSMTVILATVINLFAGVVAFAADATATDVIEIDSAEELAKIGVDTTNYPASGSYKLANDITLSGAWSPLPAFSGTFDGNGHTISGLTITSLNNTAKDTLLGMFASVSSTGAVKNLTLDQVIIDASVIASGSNTSRLDVGVIAGSTSDTATVSNCKVSGKITVTQTAESSANGRTRVGGILGYANNAIEYCVSNVVITVTSAYAGTDYSKACYVGGIVGQSVGTVEYCVNNGAVTVTAKGTYPVYAGGICGTNTTWGWGSAAVIVESCVNRGAVSATAENASAVGAGGILGYISSNNVATLKNNFNFGTISSSEYAGQILAYKNNSANPTAEKNYGLENNGNLCGNVDDAVLGATDTTENMLINQPTLGTQVVGYQTSEAVEGKFNLRLVATLEGGYANLTNVGFTVSASYGDVTKEEQTFTMETLYGSISAEENTGAIVAYTAEELGGDYIFVLACKNLPQNVGDITFTVTTFYTDANGTHSNTVQAFTVNSNEIPSADMPEAA